VASAAGLLLIGCEKKQEPSQQVIYKVEDSPLPAGEFSRQIARKLKNFDAIAAKDPANVERVKNEVLREFLVQSLVSHAAEKKNISVTKEEVAAEIKRAQNQYPNDLTLKAALASQNINYDDWKSALQQQLLQKKFFADLRKSLPQPSREQIKTYYEAHRTEFLRGPEVHIQQILVGKQEEAELLKKELKLGKNFGALALKFSLSPDAAHKGDVGFIGKGVIPVFDKAFELKPGEVSPVLKSNYGYHIIKLLEKRSASSVNYDQASAEIQKKLIAEAEEKAFSAWLEDAIHSAHVEKNDELIKRIQIETQGATD